MGIFQEQNRGEIRRSIGRNLNDVIIGTAKTTTDTSSLIDTYGLVKGGDDEYNGCQVVIYDATGSIVDGEKSFVSDFASATSDATCAPVFTDAITSGDKYELWKNFIAEEVDDAINQAIIDATSEAFFYRTTEGNYTLENEYEYDWLVPFAFGQDFKGVHKVEYCHSIGVSHTIHDCEALWDELVDADVTAALDIAYHIEGNNSMKFTVAAGLAAHDIIATDAITSLDISDCDQIEIWIRSTVALSAGDLHLLLDDTASCATPLETLDIPATRANESIIHVIDLGNPHLDTAIISVGLEMEVDKGAFTLYVDRIRAVKSASKVFKALSPQQWFLTRTDTPRLGLTPNGYGTIGINNEVRISGYCAPDYFSDDTTDSEIDPSYLIAKVTGTLLIAHAKSSQLDLVDRAKLATFWLGEAQKKLPALRCQIMPDTRWVV